MLLKIRLTFVCKYKYSKQTSNNLQQKCGIIFKIPESIKKPSQARVKDFLRLYTKH